MAKLNRGLIVSCQAVKGEPLYGLGIMRHFARCAVLGGAVGIRTGYVNEINEIKQEVSVPVIGIIKQEYEGSDVYITPTLKEVKALIDSPCEVIALDCTRRTRPEQTLDELVAYIRKNAPEKEIMADCDCIESAEEAAMAAAMDAMASREEQEEAAKVLGMMEREELRPSEEEIAEMAKA